VSDAIVLDLGEAASRVDGFSEGDEPFIVPESRSLR
jgi:hypothetical protein